MSILYHYPNFFSNKPPGRTSPNLVEYFDPTMGLDFPIQNANKHSTSVLNCKEAHVDRSASHKRWDREVSTSADAGLTSFDKGSFTSIASPISLISRLKK